MSPTGDVPNTSNVAAERPLVAHRKLLVGCEMRPPLQICWASGETKGAPELSTGTSDPIHKMSTATVSNQEAD